MQISWRPLRPLVAPVLRSTDPSRRARRRLLPPARTCRGNGCARCHDDLKRWSSHPSHPFSTVVDVLWTSLDQEAGLRSEEHTSELRTVLRDTYAALCLINKHIQ